MNNHTHTTECLAYNELNETCCLHDDNDLTNHCRHTIEFTDPMNTTCHTFTNNVDDAISLARVEHPDLNRYDARCTFVDTEHKLDEYAVFGYSRDVENPTS